MITRSIRNVRMCELKFKDTNIQVITYDLNDRDKNKVLSKVFVEGVDQFCLGSEFRDEDYDQTVRNATRKAIKGVKLFRNSTEFEIGSFLLEMQSKLRLVMPDDKVSKRMWGMRGGVINYNNKKYYAISYHTNTSKVGSFVLREDGLKVEGSDILQYERAVSDAIIKGEGINKVDFKTRFWDEDDYIYDRIIEDYDYEEEEERIEKLKNEVKKFEDDISKQMKIVFYADNETYY